MPTSERYADALRFTALLHHDQVRKDTSIPYVSHLLSVSALVWENGGTEDQAIAALLHDALEDQGDRTSYAELTDRFSSVVADIVRACSDRDEGEKPPWRERKERYLEHLRHTTPEVLLVSLADKAHNAGSILADHRVHSDAVFDRFNASKSDTVWYYRELAAVFREVLPGRLSDDLTRTVEELERRA